MPPAVAGQPFDDVQLRFVQHVSLADLRPPDDHREHAAILRRRTNVVQAGFELRLRRVKHEREL